MLRIATSDFYWDQVEREWASVKQVSASGIVNVTNPPKTAADAGSAVAAL